MAFILNFIKSLTRLFVGLVVLVCAAGIPAYFVSVDGRVVESAGEKTRSPQDLARLYIDSVKLSTAKLISESCGGDKNIDAQIAELYKDHPRWLAAGGDEPFFDAFYSSLDKNISSLKSPEKIYSLLSTQDTRGKLLNFLRQSNSPFVAKILKLRSINSTILPPVFTSAGAPLDAAILTTALLAQSGDLNRELMLELSETIEAAKGDSAKREQIERFLLAVLVFEKDCDWVELRSIMPNFASLKDAYDFSVIYTKSKQQGDLSATVKKVLLSGLLLKSDAPDCIKYLSSSDPFAVEDFTFAFRKGAGALDFLISQNRPIYREKSFVSKFLEPLTEPIKKELAPFCVDFPKGALALKIFLILLGGYLFLRGCLRLFVVRRDTPSWLSPLALVRGFLESAAAGILFLAMLEPAAFQIKIEDEPAPELRFSFDKIANTIGEETMKFNTDTATLAAVGLFLILQFLVYVFCLIRLSSIKRLTATPQMKLKLLDNEENLFDLGLYIGLGGTVVSLVLLSVGIVTASLMGAYTSTLFGILFTAIVKIFHVRRYKRKLLLETAERE